MTVKEAFDQIRKTGIDKETIYTCYVTDNKSKLIGIVTAKTLMLNDPGTVLKDIMIDNVIYCHTSDDKEEVARLINKYGFLALPVVDNEERLVGIVTVDDAMDVMQAENTEDIEKIHAIVPSDKPYLKTGVISIFLHRLPWLLILMISATFTGLILNNYEEHLSALGGLASDCVRTHAYGYGGNAGSQACVTVIRGLGARPDTIQGFVPRSVERTAHRYSACAVAGTGLLCQAYARGQTAFRLCLHPDDRVYRVVVAGYHDRGGEIRGLLASAYRKSG